MNDRIHIAIVDDDKLVVQLLSEFFQNQDRINVLINAFSGNSFINILETEQYYPDIVLLDLRMNDGNGIETIDILTSNYPTVKIIVLSSYYKPSFMGCMLKAGVDAFIPKETDKEMLLKIVFEVYERGHYFIPEQVVALREQLPTGKTPSFEKNSKDGLTQREKEILILICQQFTAKEIAKKIFVTTKTVEAHKGNLLLKTGVKNTVGLIIYAMQNKIVNANDLILLN